MLRGLIHQYGRGFGFSSCVEIVTHTSDMGVRLGPYGFVFSIVMSDERFIRWLLQRGPTSSHSEQRS